MLLLRVLTAGLFSPIAANAESVWLLLYIGKSGLDKIEMRVLDQWKENGEAHKDMKAAGFFKNYVFFEGK